MDCEECKYRPMYLCCETVFVCSSHLGKHFEINGNHQHSKLVYMSTKEEKLLKEKIISKIQDLSKLKSQILNQTKSLILKAENCANSALKKIDGFLEKYLEFIKFGVIYEEKKKEIEHIFTKDYLRSGISLKLDESLEYSYEIILNDRPSKIWKTLKLSIYSEMLLSIIPERVLISNDEKMLFICKV